MNRSITRRRLLAAMGALGGAGLLSACGADVSDTRAEGLPDQLVWSTYPAGTGTYNDVAAIANTLTQRSDVQVRLLGGDTGIARLAPLLRDVAQYARAGDEYFFAFEGNYEYASETWGPTPIRQIFAPPGNYGVLARRDAGLERIEDLRGKRVPDLIANTSMNMKIESILNLGGLTKADVRLVPISYGGQAEGIKTGQIDLMYNNVVGASVEELATENPFHWLNLNGYPEENYASWRELNATSIVAPITSAAGMREGEERHVLQYGVPLTTLAERPAEEVRAVLDDMHRYYESFKTATPDAKRFHRDVAMLEPIVVPFHDGAVSFFQDAGRWNAAHQKVQDALLVREAAMTEAWPGVFAEHRSADDLPQRWIEWKRENLKQVPTVAEATQELGIEPDRPKDIASMEEN